MPSYDEIEHEIFLLRDSINKMCSTYDISELCDSVEDARNRIETIYQSNKDRILNHCDWRNDEPSKRQLDLIKSMEDYCGIFNGKTKGDAYDYINKHIFEYKKRSLIDNNINNFNIDNISLND